MTYIIRIKKLQKLWYDYSFPNVNVLLISSYKTWKTEIYFKNWTSQVNDQINAINDNELQMLDEKFAAMKAENYNTVEINVYTLSCHI